MSLGTSGYAAQVACAGGPGVSLERQVDQTLVARRGTGHRAEANAKLLRGVATTCDQPRRYRVQPWR